MSIVVIAPDSFKGSIDAASAAREIANGWISERPQDTVVRIPQADGGEGTLDAVLAAVEGAELRHAGDVTGPDGRPRAGNWVALPGGTAVVEMAQCSGIPFMEELNPLGATSRGLGEVLAAALDAGATRVLIGIGGSASTDAGLPVLEALGDRTPPEGGAIVLTDVNAPLLGPEGAAAVFGPQKGATPSDITLLEQRLEKAAVWLGADPTTPGAGAAGGVGYALIHWGAEVESGASYISGVTGLTEALKHADVVLTGEGKFDGQSMNGKVVGSVMKLAAENDVAAGLVVGASDVTPEVWAVALAELAGSTRAAIEAPANWLQAAGRMAARQLTARSPGNADLV